jgi:ubiquinone/menaquinone biosynthesis C-methylase UbiE
VPESVSFDRAASFYDETRAMLPETAEAITDAILHQLQRANAGHLLEVGIGTGRIARPLMARGQRVAGIDISSEMMSMLLARLTPDHLTPDLAHGDATRLPFRDNSFRALLTVHVLHLVSDPVAALAEFRRVLAPGGVYLHKVQRDNEALAESSQWWDEALERHGHHPLKRFRFEDQREMIAATGAVAELIDIVSETVSNEPEEVLDAVKNRIHSWTWQVQDGTYAACLREYEPWFREHYTAPILDEATHELEVWRWPAP